MINLLNRDKVAEKIGDGVLSIQAIESCCGYGLETNINDSRSRSNVEVDGIKFLIDEETNKIAPELSIDVDGQDCLEVKNLKARSYCGCGRSFTV